MFDSAGPPTEAEREIRSRISDRGMITFREFMELALYFPHPGGYYTASGSRPASFDYYTSPAAHPAFGAAIAIQLRAIWLYLGRPDPFSVVELGAGDGLLARDALTYSERLDVPFARSLSYHAIERGESVPVVEAGCVLSNELVDAMPVARFQVSDQGAREVFVTVGSDGRLQETLDEPVTDAIAEHIGALGQELPEGFRGEVCTGIREWIEGVAATLGRGFVITIDYGGTAKELIARSGGTLQTHYRHMAGLSPYQHVGRQDMTAHVDFTAVEDEGARVGLRAIGMMTQRQLLKSCGIDAIASQLRGAGLPARELAVNLHGIREIVRPDGLGGFRVLFQERRTGASSVADIRPSRSQMARLPVPPVLGAGHLRLLEGAHPSSLIEVDQLWPMDGEASDLG